MIIFHIGHKRRQLFFLRQGAGEISYILRFHMSGGRRAAGAGSRGGFSPAYRGFKAHPRRRKKYHDMEYRWYSKDKEIIWIHCRGTVIYDGEGSIRLLVGSISEVNGEEKRDRLTGLHGEGRFALDLGRLLQKKHGAGFLLLIGVDDFKEINEKYGIESGNTLLRELTDIIRECMLPGMQLYRLVADEFVLFGQDDMCSAQVVELFEKIRRNIFRHIEEEDYRNFYTVSGGLLQLPYPSADYSELVKYLEFALNEAKRRGKTRLWHSAGRIMTSMWAGWKSRKSCVRPYLMIMKVFPCIISR